MFSWYNSENMGTLADWVGIVVTMLTIILTVRYYSKDNEKKLGIIAYPIHTKRTSDSLTYYSNPVKLAFFGINQSKVVMSVEFKEVRVKKRTNIFEKKQFKKLEEKYEDMFDYIEAEEKPPVLHTLNVGEKTDDMVINMEDVYTLISDTVSDKYLNKKQYVNFEIVYTIFTDGKSKETITRFRIPSSDVLDFKKKTPQA